MMLASFALIVFAVSFAFAENTPNDNDTEFLEKLELCQPYKGEFKHPITGEILNREVVGQVDGKCVYTEEMPNGLKMECKLSESQRKEIVKYYRELFADKIKTWHGSTKNGITKSTYSVDGEEFDNPIQKCLNGGACAISFRAPQKQKIPVSKGEGNK